MWLLESDATVRIVAARLPSLNREAPFVPDAFRSSALPAHLCLRLLALLCLGSWLSRPALGLEALAASATPAPAGCAGTCIAADAGRRRA